MLVKRADDKSGQLSELEQRMKLPGVLGKQAKEDFYKLKSGIKGERDSAYFIDFDYGDSSKNWAVIHDIRLEHNGRVAQIDHLLLNRWLEIYVVETKNFNSGVKITEDGEFLRWNDWKKTYEGMESPLLQNERHITVLKDVCATLDLPVRLGIRMQPEFHSLVLVAAGAKIMRPEKSAFDSARVIKADQLKQRIVKDIDETSPASVFLMKMPKMVSAETVHDLARQLAARHAPAQVAKPQRAEPPRAPEAVAIPAAAPSRRVREPKAEPPAKRPHDGPACKSCHGGKGRILYGKYGYYFKCDACAANTAIRFSCMPGHDPRLRKSGREFFRDCGACNTSALFHVNPEGQE